jgi:hypothetical protein
MLASTKSLCTSEAITVVMGVLDSVRMEETTTIIMMEMGTNITRKMATTIMDTVLTTITTP